MRRCGLSHRRLPAKEFVCPFGIGRAAWHSDATRNGRAETILPAVAESYADTSVAADAIYWRGVSHYKATNDHTVLGEVARN